jgi:hypothetical protein
MNKKYFALKLNPSRPDFAQTMTDEEKSIMQQHAAYWKNYMDQGKVVFSVLFLTLMLFMGLACLR